MKQIVRFQSYEQSRAGSEYWSEYQFVSFVTKYTVRSKAPETHILYRTKENRLFTQVLGEGAVELIDVNTPELESRYNFTVWELKK